jgi:hypothetical protein
MTNNKNLLSAGLHIVNRHKRFVVWFWILNLAIAWFGAVAFRQAIASTVDHSLLARRLVHGLDLPVLLELMARPDTGSTAVPTKAAAHYGLVFLFVTLIFLPGVLENYTNQGRLSREEFFRACGRNLWRFIRAFLLFGIAAGVISSALFPAEGKLVKLAGKSTNELLPFYTEVACLAVIFPLMTMIRISFDLGQIDVVFRDQRSVLRSLARGFRFAFRYLFSLLAAYVVIALVAALVLVAGLWIWHVAVPPRNIIGAFLISQLMLILWLWARFWQRAVGAAFYLREMATVPATYLAPEPIVPPTPSPEPLSGPVPEAPPV